jgi:hypothetical protein
MSNSVSHATIPYPVKGCRYTIPIPYFNSTGDPIDPSEPDTEISKDGAAFVDCTEEVTTIAGNMGMGYLTLTGDEMNASLVCVAAKATSGAASGSAIKTTLAMIFPRVLTPLRNSTATDGTSDSITLDALASPLDDYYNGCIVRTTGGTGGGGGSGSQNNQARQIVDYNGSTRVASVAPAWETNPSSGTTFEILITSEWISSLSDLRLIHGKTVTEPSDSVVIPTTVASQDDVTTISDRLTAVRAEYLDNLSGGAVALESTVQTIQASTDRIPINPAAADSPMILTSDYDAAKTALRLTDIVDGSLTLNQALNLILAVLAGKTSGGGTGTYTFKRFDGTTTALTIVCDAKGNRTSITIGSV